VAEYCTLGTGACPVDGFASATTTCVGTSNGDCDLPDSCKGDENTCVEGESQCEFRNDTSIEPTGTTCVAYRDSTTTELTEVQYNRKGQSPIKSNNPGVFFLYDGLHLDAGSITVTETIAAPDQTWKRRLPVQGASDGNPQVILYDLDCNVVYNFSNGQTFQGVTLTLGSGNTLGDLTISGVPPGDYIISVKYNADVTGCTSADCPDNGTTYTFSVSANGSPSGADDIPYNKK